MISDNDLDTLAFCAFRYALGRRSYIVSDIVAILIHNKDILDPVTKALMVVEIRKARNTNQLGMDIDTADWEKLLGHLL